MANTPEQIERILFCVSRLDLTTPERLAKIGEWKEKDGTLEGLYAAFPETKEMQPVAPTHAELMATDREYAARFIRRSFPKGHTFCVTLECVEPFDTQELFEAVESRLKPQKDTKNLKLVAGCKVMAIFTGDIGAEHMNLKATLANLSK